VSSEGDNAELEQRVRERTAELSARNAALQQQIIEHARAEEVLADEHEQLQAILNNIPDRIYFKDAQSRFLRLSKALAQRLGVENPEEAIGKTDFDFHLPEKAQEFYEDEQRVIRMGQPLVNKVEKQILRTGEIAWASTTKMPMRDRTGKIVGVVGINRDITEIKRAEEALEALNKRMLTLSRQAGMAEVATGVLHNVGNVLNSVNVSAGIIAERLRGSKVTSVSRLARILQEQDGNLARFLTEDERGRKVPAYLDQLAQNLEQERVELGKELDGLILNIEHIKGIVAMQQNYARILGVVESVEVAELMEDAFTIHGGAYARHGITVDKDYEKVPTLLVDKHAVLQILVNLLHNAKYACDATNRPDRRVTVRIRLSDPGRVKVEICDNGIGIPPENLTRIFSQGFTTRKGGHGFGLHSGALAAKQLGGTLTAHSDGTGCGATFTLELPCQPPAAE
jgi:PAS domain S-box-containing protein